MCVWPKARRSITKPRPGLRVSANGTDQTQADVAGRALRRSRSTVRTCTRAIRTRPLTVAQSKTGARNHSGRITTRHKGGGSRQKYRLIDFKRDKDGVTGVVETVEYDPNRTAHIALVKYADGERRYILAPKGVKPGDEVRSGADSPIKPGNSMALRHIPVGSLVHNIEMKPGKGGQMARSAGGSAQYTSREGLYAYIRLKSGETRKVHIDCRATLGESATTNTACASTARPARSAGAASARRSAAS